VASLNETTSLYYFLSPKELSLEAPVIELGWEEDEGGARLTLTSDVLAKDVYLTVQRSEEEGDPGSSSQGPPLSFSDNFFDLLPNQPTVVRIRGSVGFDDLQRGLRIRTLAEVPREGVPADEG
jgi:beta-mannosidase